MTSQPTVRKFVYTVESAKSFDEAVQAVESKSAEKNFRVLHTHDVAATLAERGFPRESLKIVEVCNAKYASEVLKADVNTALMLPCPISVYQEAGKTYISTMRPTLMADMYSAPAIANVAAEVEKAVLAIIDEAK
jgi:uncharacterized protein (DUF302 family)